MHYVVGAWQVERPHVHDERPRVHTSSRSVPLALLPTFELRLARHGHLRHPDCVVKRELHFYPGSRLLVFLGYEDRRTVVLARADAMGGPEHPGTDPRMPEMPTTAGRYVIDRVKPYVTPTWVTSRIAWGTPLLDRGTDVHYLVRSGVWGSLKKDFGFTPDQIRRTYYSLYGKLLIPKTWVFNDFGPMAIRYFRDLDGDGKMGPGERLMGEMIHTTPDNEAQTARGAPVKLEQSHGCVHVSPNDRDHLMGIGAFNRGTPFVVHRYSEFF